MNCTLTRKSFEKDGVFGTLTEDETGKQLAVTLEHAYLSDSLTYGEEWAPKVAAGVYVCKRHASNRLPYETFELQDVPDFQGQPVTGILIHKGNFDKDSEGCILLGQEISQQTDFRMVTSSAPTFNKFMSLQTEDTFQLTIKDV